MDSSVKKQITALVENDKLKEALRLFNDHLSERDAVETSDLAGLQGNLSTVQKAYNHNTLSFQEYSREIAKIRTAIVDFLSSSQDPASDLDRAVQSLPFDKETELGVVQLVNCDRKTAIRDFNRSFNKKKEEKQPFQYYFICGCPDQSPGGFAERILYEIVDKESLVQDGVNYPYSEGVFRRARVENLPLGLDFEAHKKKFKEYVHKRFAFADTQSFEAFIETGIPNLPYSLVATIFRIAEDCWKSDEGEILEYLQWMVDTFQTAHPKVPTFVFLFVVQLRKLYDPDSAKTAAKEVARKIDTFCADNKSAVFKEIKPVEAIDLEGWLSRIGVETNDSERVIRSLWHSIELKDRLGVEDEPVFHMKHVEPLQSKIVTVFRSKI